MTNKENIEKLEYIKNQYHVMFNFTDYDEALDLAIKAIEERPQDNEVGYQQGYECGYAQGYIDGSSGADFDDRELE